jgi:peptidoglycan/LPS O-acetylase OafA/YrhL
MVQTFFVLSGFVLSYRPLVDLLEEPPSPEHARLLLASAAFRRIFRLFPPVAVSTLVSLAFMFSGLYQRARDAGVGSWWLTTFTPSQKRATWYLQVWDALGNFVCGWIFPFMI